MSRTTTNLGLTVWDAVDDAFNPTELANNWDLLDTSIENLGTAIVKQTGTVTATGLTYTSTGDAWGSAGNILSASKTVTFGSSFTAAPFVNLEVDSGSIGISAKVTHSTITTTGFTAVFETLRSGNPNVTFYWMALL